jgi:hypothetical protein
LPATALRSSPGTWTSAARTRQLPGCQIQPARPPVSETGQRGVLVMTVGVLHQNQYSVLSATLPLLLLADTGGAV